MLKDIIIKKLIEEASKKKDSNDDILSISLKGDVEIKAWKGDKLIYHDGGDNVVTLWAKHSLIHLLSCNPYTPHGNTTRSEVRYYSKPGYPSVSATNHSSANKINLDGTLLSNKQYFWDYTDYTSYLNASWGPTETNQYSVFPTKIAFGTGFEFDTYANVPADFKSYYLEDYPNQSSFEVGINNTVNYYSNIVNGASNLTQARSVDDIVEGALADADYSEDYGIKGIVKNSFAERITAGHIYPGDGSVVEDIYLSSTNEFVPKYKGLGRPCPIYCKRTEDLYTTSSEIAVSCDILTDKPYDNRITFTCVLPEQSSQSGVNTFYPYNDTTLKQVGLFCDSLLTIEGSAPSNISEIGYEGYRCMPIGIMFAKRNITPITKDIDVRVSVAWSIYTTGV